MGDALISAVAKRLIAILEEQVRNEVNLVRGVKKKVRNMSTELNRVRDLLDDADRRGYQDKGIKNWLKWLEDTSYEMDDVLDEWKISLHKLQMERQDSSEAHPRQKVFPFIPYSSCLCFKKVATRRDFAVKIKNVKAQLDAILEEGKRYNFVSNQRTNSFGMPGRNTTSFVEVEEVKGRDNDRDIVVNKLIEKSSSASQGDQLRMTSIVGQGGIGKTTLAQLVYNDSRVKDCFALRIWICVSDPFDEASIAKAIVEKVQGSNPSTDQLQRLLELLTEYISGKKFLLVLDDVWNGENSKWEPLKNSLKISCAAGSRILVTTRNERVAIEIGTTKNEIHHLGLLSDDDCWLLLRRIAFSERSGEINKGLLDISCEIARRCKGLPLAAKTLGSLLRFKNTAEEWGDVLNSKIWQLESMKVEIFRHLLLSYNELSLTQKRCFSYCAVFPKDHVINVDVLIKCWMALGYLNSVEGDASELELRGREYFDNLAMRSLFQDFEKDQFNRNIIVRCKMHDIVHDFALYLRESDELNRSNGKVEAAILEISSSCQACSPLVDVSCIKKYRSMFLFDERSFDIHVCDCLKSLKLLSLRQCGLISIPKEIEKLIHLRFLDLSNNEVTSEDLKSSICRLYNLRTLLLSRCKLIEIPFEIGNLIQLRHLDLSLNDMKKLPESICDLRELRSLDIIGCSRCRLPQGIDWLINLKHLNNYSIEFVRQHPQGLAQLTSLRTLSTIRIGGSDLTKLGCLKNLNNLSGSLKLQIKLGKNSEDDIEDARQSELSKKIHLQYIEMDFSYDEIDDGEEEEEEEFCARRINVLDALRPNPNLSYLQIRAFKGSKVPEWITSPIYQLRRIELVRCNYLSSLPPLGKLPCLEELEIGLMRGFQYAGREFLGITSSSSSMVSSSSSSSSTFTGFPKLKALSLSNCDKWTEWEDITAEEEESATVSVLPSLTVLKVCSCKQLAVLPHRLLRKAPLIEKLYLNNSHELVKSYEEGSLRKFISHIPNITFWD